jgi:hypothetical protein
MKKTLASLLATIALLFSGSAMAQDNPLAGLELQLKNADGKVVKTCITKDDGSWSFDGLTEGEYTLGVDGQKVTKSRSNIQNNRVMMMKAKEKANRSKSATADADSDGDGVDIEFTLNFNKITYKNESREAGSGMATGKRQHAPVTFVKEWNASTPQLFNVTASGGTISGKASWDLATLKK